MICPICNTTVATQALICPACGWTFALGVSDALPLGTLLRNRQFRLESQLGQGGFGITYLARDQTLHRQVAIKELFLSDWKRIGQAVQQPGKLTTAEFQDIKTKFLTEARVLAGFNDPSIVRVYDQFTENNTAYLVMEYLQGETLEQRLVRDLTLPAAEVSAMAGRVLVGLRLLHAQGLLHRDIKPGNIFLEHTGRVVLIDFGSVRAFQVGKTTAMTQHLTPGYAPLEQYAAQGKVGPPSDLYSLGATLYHALSGTMPPAASELALGASLPALPRPTPAALQQVIISAMKVRMDERPQTVDDFLARLTGPAQPQPAAPKPPRATPPAPPSPAPPPQFPGRKPLVAYLQSKGWRPDEFQSRLASGAVQVATLPPEVRRHLEAMGWLNAQGHLTFQPGAAKPQPAAPIPQAPRPHVPVPAPLPPVPARAPRPPSTPTPPAPLPALPDPADIHRLWAAIEAVPAPHLAPLTVPALSRFRKGRHLGGFGGGLKGAAAFVVLGALLLPFAGGVPAGLCFLLALFTLLAPLASTGEPQVPTDIAALDQRITLLQAPYLQATASQTRFGEVRKQLSQVKDQLLGPAVLLRQRQQEAHQALISRHFETELRRYPLEAGTIPGIGVQRVNSLQQHGIHTAYDVTPQRLGGIPGFGEKITRDLLAWRRGLERTVEAAVQRLPDDPRVTATAVAELWALREQLAQGLQALQQVAADAAEERHRAQLNLNSAAEQRETLNRQR